MTEETRKKKRAAWLQEHRDDIHVVNDYRQKYQLDLSTTVQQLRDLGLAVTPQLLEQAKADDAEYRVRKAQRDELKRQRYLERKEQRRREKESAREGLDDYDFCDGTFAYIAGYTGGGAPYGVTWEEMGIDPDLPFEERIARLRETESRESSYSAGRTYNLSALTVSVLPDEFSVCRAQCLRELPPGADCCFLVSDGTAVSLVCRTRDVPARVQERSDGWRAFLAGEEYSRFDADILSAITGLLLEYEIPFYIPYVGDDVLVLTKDTALRQVLYILKDAGAHIPDADQLS